MNATNIFTIITINSNKGNRCKLDHSSDVIELLSMLSITTRKKGGKLTTTSKTYKPEVRIGIWE